MGSKGAKQNSVSSLLLREAYRFFELQAPSKMASATLSLCSSLALNCRISQKSQNPFFSNPNLSFLSLSSHKLPLPSAIASSRPTFPFLSKSSESETSVVEAEPEVAPVTEVEPEVVPKTEPEPDVAPESEATEIVEASSEQAPKREEVFAVVMVCFSWSGLTVTQLKFDFMEV